MVISRNVYVRCRQGTLIFLCRVYRDYRAYLLRMDKGVNEAPQKAENPYLDSDFDFGKENAFMLNEVQNDIAFNLNKIQQKYIYAKMGRLFVPQVGRLQFI